MTSIHEPPVDATRSAFLGALIADAVAMPVHWYYDQVVLDRDYPQLAEATSVPQLAEVTSAGSPLYLAPRNPHSDTAMRSTQP